MQLEDYFDVLAPDDIRLKGHRIGIETVLYEFIHHDRCVEEIQRQFPTLALEVVYATILYYLHDRERVGKYLTDWLEYKEQVREDARRNPSSATTRMLALRDEISAYPPEEREAARNHIRERERGQSRQIETVDAA